MKFKVHSFLIPVFYITILIIFFYDCSSSEIKDYPVLEDSSYQIKFSPCICRRQDMIVQAKRTILLQGIKDYEEITSKHVEPELESKMIEDDYDHFLYDFSLDEKLKDNPSNLENTITAEAKVKQQKLNQFVEANSKNNRYKTQKPDYGSKGLEVIKGFQSDRRKHKTIGDISKSKSPTILLYEIKRK